MRKSIKRMVGEMARKGVSAKMIHLAVTRVHPTTRLKRSTVEKLRRGADRPSHARA